MTTRIAATRPDPDRILVDIADYVLNFKVESREAFETARYCLIDALGCGLEALAYPACSKLLGPVVPGTVVPDTAGRDHDPGWVVPSASSLGPKGTIPMGHEARTPTPAA